MASALDYFFPNELDDAQTFGITASFPVGQSIELDSGVEITQVRFRVAQDFGGFGQSPPSDEHVFATVATGSPGSLTIQATSHLIPLDELAEFTNNNDKPTPVQFVFDSPYTTTSSGLHYIICDTTRTSSNPGVLVWVLATSPETSNYYPDGTYVDVGNGTTDDEYDVEFGINVGTLYVSNTGFRFPYPRWT